MKKIILHFFMILCISSLSIVEVDASTFQDVDSVPWAAEEIRFLANEGIISGYSESRFAPRENITRAQAALMLVNALYTDDSISSNLPFSDVDEDYFYYPAIAAAYEKGLISGYLDGTFRPDAPITRAEAAVMMDNAFNLERGSTVASFRDVNGWALESVLDLASQGIISGYEDGTFQPNKAINRAEFAVVLAKTLNPVMAEQMVRNDVSDHPKAFERRVVELTNEERVSRGLTPLILDTNLSDLARLKSQDMINNQYFDHQSPTYGSPFAMLEDAGISYQMAAENIAAGQTTPEEVVTDWMNSKGHRQNILREGLTHIGVGLAKGGEYGNYWTQLFIAK